MRDDVMRDERNRTMRAVGRVGVAVALAVSVGCVPAAGALAEEGWEEMPSAVEDGTYPGADEIYAEYGIRLLIGDGGIVFAGVKNRGEGSCAAGEIQVEQVMEDSAVRFSCFQVLGGSGVLTMEIPAAFNVRSGEDSLRVTVRDTDGTEKVLDVAADATRYVGFEAASEVARTTLVELRIQP
jgi:hypothetical protein